MIVANAFGNSANRPTFIADSTRRTRVKVWWFVDSVFRLRAANVGVSKTLVVLVRLPPPIRCKDILISFSPSQLDFCRHGRDYVSSEGLVQRSML